MVLESQKLTLKQELLLFILVSQNLKLYSNYVLIQFNDTKILKIFVLKNFDMKFINYSLIMYDILKSVNHW